MDFLNMEDLLLYLLRGHYIKLARWHNQQELLVVCLGSRQANNLEHGVETSINLILEAALLSIVNDGKLGMAHPSINQLFVKLYSLVHSLVPRLIIDICVELGRAIRCRHQVNYRFVSSVAQLNRRPGSLVQQRLPHILISVSHAVHHTTIAKNHDILIAGERSLQESIL